MCIRRPAHPVPGFRSVQFHDKDVMELDGNWGGETREDNQPRGPAI
jgi:hypothetical protein